MDLYSKLGSQAGAKSTLAERPATAEPGCSALLGALRAQRHSPCLLPAAKPSHKAMNRLIEVDRCWASPNGCFLDVFCDINQKTRSKIGVLESNYLLIPTSKTSQKGAAVFKATCLLSICKTCGAFNGAKLRGPLIRCQFTCQPRQRIRRSLLRSPQEKISRV